MPLAEALIDGVAPVRDAVSAALADEPRLAGPASAWSAPGWWRSGPSPSWSGRCRRRPARAVQQEADRATYERRAQAVERERAIAENELQNKIELARREQQLRRAARRQRPPPGRAGRRRRSSGRRAGPRPSATRSLAGGEAETERAAAPRPGPTGVRVVGLAEAEAEAARLAAYRDLPAEVLRALALQASSPASCRRSASSPITPDVLTGLLASSGRRADACADER